MWLRLCREAEVQEVGQQQGTTTDKVKHRVSWTFKELEVDEKEGLS